MTAHEEDLDEQETLARQHRQLDAAGHPLPLPLPKGEAQCWAMRHFEAGIARSVLEGVIDRQAREQARTYVGDDVGLMIVMHNWATARRAVDEYTPRSEIIHG